MHTHKKEGKRQKTRLWSIPGFFDYATRQHVKNAEKLRETSKFCMKVAENIVSSFMLVTDNTRYFVRQIGKDLAESPCFPTSH